MSSEAVRPWPRATLGHLASRRSAEEGGRGNEKEGKGASGWLVGTGWSAQGEATRVSREAWRLALVRGTHARAKGWLRGESGLARDGQEAKPWAKEETKGGLVQDRGRRLAKPEVSWCARREERPRGALLLPKVEDDLTARARLVSDSRQRGAHELVWPSQMEMGPVGTVLGFEPQEQC